MTNNNMCLLWGFVFIATLMGIGTGVEGVTQFKVGESFGWREPDENNTAVYSQWAAKNRFLVGDSLYFEYTNDTVLVVDKGGYYHCNLAKPIFTFKDGKTVIKLEKPGPAYFISGIPDHCKNGQRLVVNVISPHPTPETPPSIASPPQPFFPESPAPSPADSSSAVPVTSISILMALLITAIFAVLV